jgi:hypothetical protein
MIGTWMAGDSFKTFYYYYRDTPIYFFVCGCFQLSIDFLIGYQLYAYRNNQLHIALEEDSESGPESAAEPEEEQDQ